MPENSQPQKTQKNVLEFLKFALVALSSLVIDFAVLNLLVIVFHTNVYLATSISFIVAATNAYIWNRIWTFKSKGNKATEYTQFFIVRGTGFGLNLLAMFVFIQYAHLWFNYAKIISLILVFIWNYIWSKFWVFKQKSKIQTQS
ncbi:MAG TPA: GtrA family protein [Patescibacteria group bacterium]|nr:GtrA family protein [Patescibacteria group bacterium]